MDGAYGSARDRLGRTLGGKYYLKEVLGAGGTAVVYRATCDDGTTVAVKVLHDHLSRSEEVCRRFVREGQLGNVLDHPGTVRVLDHGATEEGCPYLVLEFLEGESLEERRVRTGGRLDLWETLDFCDQLLAVLDVAHAKNIVHRDIKPSNLFVTSSGVLKVLDFGIARITDDTSATSTKTGQMVGTPAFMPPEQALSRPREVDARTDIWSVGATMFTLLSGEHVHIAETSSEHLVKAATLHARSLARALPGVPANVEALVAKCLSFDKNERWESAASMRVELSRVRADPGRRIGTSTSPPPNRTPSDPNMPTVISSGRVSVASMSTDGKPSSSRSDRPSEMNMALSSNPGASPFKPRQRWLVPAAIASIVLLFAMGGLVMMVSIRTTTSSQAAIAPPNRVAANALSSVTELTPPTIASSISGTTADAVAATAPTPGGSMARPTPPSGSAAPPNTSAARTSTPSVKKSSPVPASRKDVYKPF